MLCSRTHCSRRDWLRHRRIARCQSHPVCKRRAHETFQRGAGGMVPAGSKLEHTEVATFSYTLVLVSVAVPSMRSPPPSPCRSELTQRSSGALEGMSRYVRSSKVQQAISHPLRTGKEQGHGCWRTGLRWFKTRAPTAAWLEYTLESISVAVPSM